MVRYALIVSEVRSFLRRVVQYGDPEPWHTEILSLYSSGKLGETPGPRHVRFGDGHELITAR